MRLGASDSKAALEIDKLAVLVGLVALGSVVTATVASVLVVGIMMVVAGIAGASWISIGLDLRARARR